MTSFDDVRKRASLPTRSVSMCLAGELVGELQRLEAELAATPAASNVGDGTRRELMERIEAARQEMLDSTVEFRLRALPGHQWGLFSVGAPTQAEGESRADWEKRLHPFHVEMVKRTVVEPEMTLDETAELADLLHMPAWVQLLNECYDVNRGSVDIPNSAAASDSTQGSEPN